MWFAVNNRNKRTGSTFNCFGPQHLRPIISAKVISIDGGISGRIKGTNSIDRPAHRADLRKIPRMLLERGSVLAIPVTGEPMNKTPLEVVPGKWMQQLAQKLLIAICVVMSAG